MKSSLTDRHTYIEICRGRGKCLQVCIPIAAIIIRDIKAHVAIVVM